VVSGTLVRRVRDLGPEMTRRTDAELRGLRHVLSERLANDESPDGVMANAFAAVLEAARRVAGHVYADADLMAGAALHAGRAVQAEDNGGNHFVAMLPSYLCAVHQEGVDYVTTTAALAQRGLQETASLCAALGLRATLLPGTQVSGEGAVPAPAADITVGSYQRLAFEYLGEHLAPGPAARRRQLAIVDQIDAILIDQAVLPLVIRAPKPPNAELYHAMATAAAELRRGKHYEIDKETGAVTLSGDGLARGGELLRVSTLEGLRAAVPRRYLEDALRAKDWYRLGEDYRVAGAGIAISAEPGSRLAGAARLREGILQAIEAKEGLATSPEEAVWARITVSDYFRTYPRLSGISGVTAHSGQEMETLYGLATAVIPAGGATRVDHPDLLFDTAQIRFEALAKDAVARHRAGQPLVIRVLTAAESDLVGRLLAERKVEHRALLPGDEEAASDVLARAGDAGAVTVLTGQVARGYDIWLPGPSPGRREAPAGLAVLAVGHSRSWRSDHWLRGLAGRRGNPGESRFYLSGEDPLLRGLHSRAWGALPARIRQRADGAPLSGAQHRVVGGIQQKAEQADSRRRGEHQAADGVERAQRVQVYSLIEELAGQSDLAGFVGKQIDEVAALYVRRYRDPDRLLSRLALLYPTRLTIGDLTAPGADSHTGDPDAARVAGIRADAHLAYARHAQFLGLDTMRKTERRIVFSVLNRRWSEHLGELEAMRSAVVPDSGSPDWLPEYRDAAASRYAAMREKAAEDIVGYAFHSEPGTQ
jgi:preprotein translocase subunit SecA